MTRDNHPPVWVRVSGCVLLAGWLAGCSAQQLYREGIFELDAGRWEVGLSKLEDAVKKDPGNAFLRAELRQRREHVVTQLVQAGDAARAASRYQDARLLYGRALGLDENNAQARTGLALTNQAELSHDDLQTVKEMLSRNEVQEAQKVLTRILAQDPANQKARFLQAELEAQAETSKTATPKLRLTEERIALLEFREAPLSMVFEALSRTGGINFVLDKDVKGDAKTSIFVKDLPVESALSLVLAQHGLEKKLLSDNTLLIYPETIEKRRKYEEQVVKSFHLTNADPKQAMNLVKVMLDAKVLFIDERAKLLVVRDTPTVVQMAEKLLASLDQGDAEVMMEVEIVEIQRTKLQELGMKYPSQIALSALAPGAASPGSMLWKDVFTINADRTLVSPLGATIDLRREDSDANILASPRIRARNYEKAKILIGDRVPVITNAVTPTTVGSSVVTGSVQYIDVGLKFEVEPTIYRDDEVAMKVNLEVSTIVREILNTVSGTQAYQIGTRTASTVLRLRDGETQVLAGLISDEDRENISKVPGLGAIPILGRLFSSQKNDNKKTEIVLSITPHVIRHTRLPGGSTSEFFYGSESTRGVPLTIHSGENERKPAAPLKESFLDAGAATATAFVPGAAALAGTAQAGAHAITPAAEGAKPAGAGKMPGGGAAALPISSQGSSGGGLP